MRKKKRKVKKMISGDYEYKTHRGNFYRKPVKGGPWETQIKDESMRDRAIAKLEDSIRAEQAVAEKEHKEKGFLKRTFSKKTTEKLHNLKEALKDIKQGGADGLLTKWVPVEGNPFNA